MAPTQNPLQRAVHGAGLRHVGHALRQLWWELRLWLIHAMNTLRAQRYRHTRDIKLHLGCGPKVKPGWLNVDTNPAADLQLDLRRPLPLPDGSCALTYSEHFFEHLEYPGDALAFLRECHRVLRAGGRISIGIPDGTQGLSWYHEAVARGEQDLEPDRYLPAWSRTPMERLNFFFRQNYAPWLHEHRMVYDFDTLEKALKLADFRDIRRRDFDPATDSEDRRTTTLYVDALK